MRVMFGPSIEKLYWNYAGMVLRRARQLVGDSAAEDLAHEVFLKAAGRWLDFRREASCATWLYRITTNLCLNHIRNEATRRRQAASYSAPLSTGLPVDERLSVTELLARLPDELREVAVYYYVDQMDQHEIAALTGVTERTVRNRLQAFVAQARGQLGWKEALP